MPKPPEEEKDVEVAVALIKLTTEMIPWVGKVIAEVGNVYLNPLERRKQRWIHEVSVALEEIHQRFNLLPEELEKSERFVSFLYQATLTSLKNHQQEKINALRAALISSADPKNTSDDLIFQFFRYIDELSITHILLLRCLDDHCESLRHLEDLDTVYDLIMRRSDLRFSKFEFRAFLKDLESRFLVSSGDIEEISEYASKREALVTENSKVNPLAVTEIGSQLLSFIVFTKP